MPHISADLLDLLTHRRVLLLQGKMGLFFSKFATFLHKHDIQVSKVNFNAGDAFFYQHQPAYNFRGRQHELESWLDALITELNIDAVVCLGDSRPHHLVARELLQKRNIPLYVFEEGYIRPHYITLEKHGTNAFSRIKLSDALHSSHTSLTPEKSIKIKNDFSHMAWTISFYYIICLLFKFRFPHYQHYRKISIWREALSWTRVLYYRYVEKGHNQRLQQLLSHQLSGQYFLVTLQVHNDFQITQHSHYEDVDDFLVDTIKSFAAHADAEHHLVFKHHPMDRGHRHYASRINKLAKQYGLSGRVHYGCEMHLPTLIKNSIGMVTINSTTGLQSLYHKTPVLALSPAVYNQDGLTAQCSMDDFWTHTDTVDYENYVSFRELLLRTCQLNGTFYDKNPWMDVIYPIEKSNNTNEGISKNHNTAAEVVDEAISASHVRQAEIDKTTAA